MKKKPLKTTFRCSVCGKNKPMSVKRLVRLPWDLRSKASCPKCAKFVF